MNTPFEEYKPTASHDANFWRQIGLPARGRELHERLHEGMAYTVYPKLAKLAGIEQKALARYVEIPPATLSRRVKSGRFKVAESDRLYRFAELFRAATELFEGDTSSARDWLLKPNYGLGERRPIEMITTSAEFQTVLNLIGRLEHGVTS
ncbi:antitoxin Xre/MbcA/ParS toxin-binding domain-containing protein [Salinicola peritrichatus]|uniref:type II RES/Xre toxin-antitoxin system antitoxin n=1 Tax=Salinicola peritrichatus TaxID=1267424 RepID=UPI000DA19DEF|nr:antitoxin Xre/MbcA/ParS toxin-binding domain-containing protein [Salinicola peritrichatus]